MAEAPIRGQLLLLSSTAEAVAPYVVAAKKLDVEYALGIEAKAAASVVQPLSETRTEAHVPVLPLSFAQPESALEIVEYAMEHPLAAIVAADELCAPSCARASSMMGLPSNPPKAADACLDKFSLRQSLSNAGLRTPLLGEMPADPTRRRIALAAILSDGKMRVLGAAVEQTTGEIVGAGSPEIPRSALEAVWRATRVVSLSYGPVCARLVIASGEAYILDLAPAIPMSLLEVLHFRIPLVDDDVSLAEVILRHALGLDIARVHRKPSPGA